MQKGQELLQRLKNPKVGWRFLQTHQASVNAPQSHERQLKAQDQLLETGLGLNQSRLSNVVELDQVKWLPRRIYHLQVRRY